MARGNFGTVSSRSIGVTPRHVVGVVACRPRHKFPAQRHVEEGNDRTMPCRYHYYNRKRALIRRETRASGSSPGGKKQMLVYVPPHPLVKHWISVLRSSETPPPVFRSAAQEIGKILLYELIRDWMPTMDAQVMTPTGQMADATFVDPTKPLILVPVLRAGLVLLEHAQPLIPSSITYHVGYKRDESTLNASCYLNTLPSTLAPDGQYIVSDMMLATGGTMMQVIQDMVDRGADPSNIRIVSALAAPPALQKLNETFPGLVVYTGMIDAEVNDKGYIIPGVGDAGDRSFGT